jgi:hypothetical protein
MWKFNKNKNQRRSAKAKGLTIQCDGQKKVETRDNSKNREESENP